MKSLLRSRSVQYVLPRLVERYLWLIFHTNKWTIDGAENFVAQGVGLSAVISFWHEHLLAMPAMAMLARRTLGYHPTPIYALISRHRDGQIIGAVVRQFRSNRCLDRPPEAGSADFVECCAYYSAVVS